MSLTVLYVYQWFITVCLWLYCTSITVIHHGMSLTVLYVYHSDLSRYVSDRTVRLSQWFITACLWPYCTSISDLSRYVFDRTVRLSVIYHGMSPTTVRLSQWFITACLWLYCTSITVIYHGMSLTVLYVYHSDLSRYVSDCTVRLSQWFITVCLWPYCTSITVTYHATMYFIFGQAGLDWSNFYHVYCIYLNYLFVISHILYTLNIYERAVARLGINKEKPNMPEHLFNMDKRM
jgi:hypothetical protein